eukprot:SAG11_NODE_429_length_9534_cov_14.689242_7_plen_105_part_00
MHHIWCAYASKHRGIAYGRAASQGSVSYNAMRMGFLGDIHTIHAAREENVENMAELNLFQELLLRHHVDATPYFDHLRSFANGVQHRVDDIHEGVCICCVTRAH